MNKVHIKGSIIFRWNIIFSILSSKSLIISNIRHNSIKPGINNSEVNFLRLIESITTGSKFIINESGTIIKIRPGFLSGGLSLIHHSCSSRGLGFYIEPLLILLPFAKKRTEIILKGLTNHKMDVSVDTLRSVYIPLLKNFGIKTLSLDINYRGIDFDNLGEVKLTVNPIKILKSIDFTNLGKIEKIRGLCYTCKINKTISSRVRFAARTILNNLISDIWIFTDHQSINDGATIPGYGLSLFAESTSKSLLHVDHCASNNMTPEEFGEKIACHLLNEVGSRTYWSSTLQPFIFILMTLTPQDISRCKTSYLTNFGIEVLRALRIYFDIKFKFKCQKDNTIICSCQGIGYLNFIKQTT